METAISAPLQISTGTITINQSHMNSDVMSDGISEPSSPESTTFDPHDLLANAVSDDVTAQLAASGIIGKAAAAAIVSAKKRKRAHHFETNPANRKRQQTRLLRKLKVCIEEYTTRVGQQAVVLCCTPGKASQSGVSLNSYKVFGSQPLETVIRNCRGMIMQDLESALAEQAPVNPDNSGMQELPPLSIDGIPTAVDKMTQAQLRAFIPLMLKYSTGRGKPGWGKMEYRPVWWPNDLPWANVRSDARSEEEKQKVSWTEALRTIVKNCYKNHGREELLHAFSDELNITHASASQHPTQYSGTMVQTVNNPDGTISIVQIDTAHVGSIVTLPDGTQATVVHAINDTQHEASQAVQTLAEVATNQNNMGAHVATVVNPTMGMLNHTAGTVNTLSAMGQDGNQLVFNGEVALGSGDCPSGVITIPVSLYQIVGAPGVTYTSNHMDTSQQQSLTVSMDTSQIATMQVPTSSLNDVTKNELTVSSVEVMPIDQNS
ncbi:DNA-binding protein P3A2-like [Gigantopelta aegis]|uniref:DNA-binding protein P3A2-like n=1 Tax=Gigantopelta aegis TaxID=1735272 RepID=UPI001B88A0D0|nr:DNA-binding protein P3A2-like [Gigantopelta aegis]XP_041350113.1 DNA-binding protein P3A2-like [Gigantopelta aegis]XP_041350114.1 DNA-binding protein P3A2-like [Gigantopelta aegis]